MARRAAKLSLGEWRARVRDRIYGTITAGYFARALAADEYETICRALQDALAAEDDAGLLRLLDEHRPDPTLRARPPDPASSSAAHATSGQRRRTPASATRRAGGR